jgi:hypothetical protein
MRGSVESCLGDLHAMFGAGYMHGGQASPVGVADGFSGGRRTRFEWLLQVRYMWASTGASSLDANPTTERLPA